MDFRDVVGLLATSLAALAIMGTGLVWLIRNVVRDEIKKAPYQYSPGSVTVATHSQTCPLKSIE